MTTLLISLWVLLSNIATAIAVWLICKHIMSPPVRKVLDRHPPKRQNLPGKVWAAIAVLALVAGLALAPDWVWDILGKFGGEPHKYYDKSN